LLAFDSKDDIMGQGRISNDRVSDFAETLLLAALRETSPSALTAVVNVVEAVLDGRPTAHGEIVTTDSATGAALPSA